METDIILELTWRARGAKAIGDHDLEALCWANISLIAKGRAQTAANDSARKAREGKAGQ